MPISTPLVATTPHTFPARVSQILKNPEKRALYDEHGEEGVEAGGGGGGPRDIFEAMGLRQERPTGPRKTDDLVHPLAVSLEDLYLGKSLRIAVSATSYEKDPGGSVMDRAGNRYNKKQERVLLEVTIDKGMQHGQRITFEGKGNTMPGALRGDVVLVIQQKEHDVFKRSGCDLVIKKEITLLEALTGPSFIVEALDGRKVRTASGRLPVRLQGAPRPPRPAADLCHSQAGGGLRARLGEAGRRRGHARGRPLAGPGRPPRPVRGQVPGAPRALRGVDSAAQRHPPRARDPASCAAPRHGPRRARGGGHGGAEGARAPREGCL